jgi:hypothetical protein
MNCFLCGSEFTGYGSALGMMSILQIAEGLQRVVARIIYQYGGIQ